MSVQFPSGEQHWVLPCNRVTVTNQDKAQGTPGPSAGDWEAGVSGKATGGRCLGAQRYPGQISKQGCQLRARHPRGQGGYGGALSRGRAGLDCSVLSREHPMPGLDMRDVSGKEHPK